jgi:tripartite ATP-independent transporter DctM subunit
MFVLCLFYRSLRLRDLPEIFKETVAVSAAVMLIVSSASLLGYIMARERVPQKLSEALFSLTDNPTVFLLLVALVTLVLGTAIDATAVLVLTVPIILPISNAFGVDPIALGVLLIISNMIGLLTPPVGTVLYVLSAITKAPTSTVFYGTLPFMIPLLVICGLIIAFPDAITWLPGVLGL